MGIPSPVALRRRERSERRRAAPGSCRLRLGDEEFRHSLEVQDPADQQRLLPNAPQTAPTEAPQPVPVLALAEELLDQLPAPLGQLVAAPARAHAHAGMRLSAAAGLRRDVTYWLEQVAGETAALACHLVYLKTAKALGLTIPQSLLQRADQVPWTRSCGQPTRPRKRS